MYYFNSYVNLQCERFVFSKFIIYYFYSQNTTVRGKNLSKGGKGQAQQAEPVATKDVPPNPKILPTMLIKIDVGEEVSYSKPVTSVDPGQWMYLYFYISSN